MKTFSLGKDKNGKDKLKIWEYEHDEDITILFNPWCKRKSVIGKVRVWKIELEIHIYPWFCEC